MVAKALISSVGSGVGYGVLRALRMSGQPFHVIGLNSLALGAGVYGCDTAYLVPPLTEADSYLQTLLGIVEAECPDIVIPGRDAELPVLVRVRDELQQHGAFLMIGSESAIEICTDKYLTAQQLCAAGLPFVPTARSRAEVIALAEQYGFPLLVKPAAGCASRNVWVAWCWDDLETLNIEDDNWVIQKYLVPVEWGCSRQADRSPSKAIASTQWSRVESNWMVWRSVWRNDVPADPSGAWSWSPMARRMVRSTWLKLWRALRSGRSGQSKPASDSRRWARSDSTAR